MLQSLSDWHCNYVKKVEYMIAKTISDKKLFDQSVDCYGIFVDESQIKTVGSLLDETCFSSATALLKKRNFSGKALESLLIPVSFGKKNTIAHVILVGLGKKESATIENYRRAVGKMVRAASDIKAESLALSIGSEKFFGVSFDYLVQQTAIIAEVAAYHFNDYITDTSRKQNSLQSIVLCVEPKQKKDAQAALDHANIIAKAINTARHWIDMPPIDLTPEYLAKQAQEIARKKKLGITVFDEKKINALGMGGLSAVSRGSELDCRLVVMEYKTKKKNAPTVAFVGKGITFDSGGLSLKPAKSMETMKEDMSGAAAVIAVMEAIADLQPDINIIGVTPISENLPSGNAIKPGDIVTFYNGKTAEIKNTDAEGRLILADALSYAVKHYKLDAIIDFATLTGACSYALGPFYTGLFGLHDTLIERIKKAAVTSGDQVWRLPMGDDYKQAIVSSVADICNIGNEQVRAGGTTAAHFLQHFVGDVAWAHLDIAGTAFDVPNISYYRPGATGAGVRLMIELALNWQSK